MQQPILAWQRGPRVRQPELYRPRSVAFEVDSAAKTSPTGAPVPVLEPLALAVARTGHSQQNIVRSVCCRQFVSDGRPLADPAHPHAFWLPEDADSDGWIDHISVYIESGIDDDVRARLDRITRLWLAPRHRRSDDEPEPATVSARP